MTSHVEQRTTQLNQNSGMYPTNSQTGGRGALSSGPAQGDARGRADNTNANFTEGTGNTQGSGFTGQQGQHQQAPPPVHPDRAGQDGQFDQRGGQGAPGMSANQGQNDQYPSQGQNTTQQTNQGLTSGDNHTGGGKLAHNGEHEGRHDQGTGILSGRHDQSTNTNQGGKLAQELHGPGEHGGTHDQGTGPLSGQHDQHTNTSQGVTGGQHAGGATRAAEAGAAYEGGKLAHEAGGQSHQGGKLTGRHDNNATNTNGPGYGTGPTSGTTGTGAETGYPTGQMGERTALGTGTGAGGVGTAAGLGGAAGAAHPGAGRGVGAGQGTGTYAGQGPVGMGTTAGTTAPGAHTGAVPGKPTTSTGTSSSGQANIILGKVQQAGGMLLSNSEMKAKGLEREAKGVAVTNPQEANRLESKATTQWEKAGAGSKIPGAVAGDPARRNP